MTMGLRLCEMTRQFAARSLRKCKCDWGGKAWNHSDSHLSRRVRLCIIIQNDHFCSPRRWICPGSPKLQLRRSSLLLPGVAVVSTTALVCAEAGDDIHLPQAPMRSWWTSQATVPTWSSTGVVFMCVLAKCLWAATFWQPLLEVLRLLGAAAYTIAWKLQYEEDLYTSLCLRTTYE